MVINKYLIEFFLLLQFNNLHSQTDVLNDLVKTLPSQHGVYNIVFNAPVDVKKVDKWMNKNGYHILSDKKEEFIRFGDISVAMQN